MSGGAHRLAPEDAAVLVKRARAGDAAAWNELVDGFLGLLTASLRAMRLSDSDVRDVTQTTWLRLVQNIDRIDDPARVGSWLVTTARREALRVISQRRMCDVRLEPDESMWEDHTATAAFESVLDDERDAAVREVFLRMPPRCRALLAQLFQEPRRPYEEISRELSMPVGSIGPTRARCLKKFCALAAECGLDLHALALR